MVLKRKNVFFNLKAFVLKQALIITCFHLPVIIAAVWFDVLSHYVIYMAAEIN